MADLKIPCTCPVCLKTRLIWKQQAKRLEFTGRCHKCNVQAARRHGRCKLPIYPSWFTMIQRCKNSKHVKYPDYGRRGITVCSRWLRFENFYADMGDRPPGMSVERRDNDGDYCPENCYWATTEQQANNTRRNHLIVYSGETATMAQMAQKYGINYYTLRSRLNISGWTIERALTEPINRHY